MGWSLGLCFWIASGGASLLITCPCCNGSVIEADKIGNIAFNS